MFVQGSAASSSGSRFAECPCCKRSVALHFINEHLDRCAAAPPPATPQPRPPSATAEQSRPPSATAEQPRPPSVAAAVPAAPPPLSFGSSASPRLSFGSPASPLLSTPIARAFGAGAPASASPARPLVLARAPFMPQHSSRLGGDTHPGAGSNLSCDPRRRNAWLGERAGPASRAPGAAIAAVAGEGLTLARG